MEYSIKNFSKNKKNEDFSDYILGADVGGTNINIGIAGIKKSKPILLFSLNFKTKNLESIIPAINKTLQFTNNNYNIKIKNACIGAAGIISTKNDYAELTNIKWDINLKEIKNQTTLKKIYLINDFEGVGYAINFLDQNNKKNIIKIKNGKKYENKIKPTKAILGAGTGLGKSIIIYNKNIDLYVPIKSEGGHEDLPIYNKKELDLIEFIKKQNQIIKPINYEEVLSGRGIENIYSYFRFKEKIKETKYTEIIDKSDNKPALITKYKELDKTCKETIKIYTKFYARCAKNFVLDTLAEGGLYIYGGIAVKNKEIFTSKEFTNEFTKSHRREDILKKIPINIIMNYDAGLYGAFYAAIYHLNNR
jgi:glucokinase